MFFIIGGDGKEYGPVPADQVRQWISSGRANLDTRAKQQGTDEWHRLGDFAEFGTTDTFTPPPLLPSAQSAAALDVAPLRVAAPIDDLADRGMRLVARLMDWVVSSLACLPGLLVLGPAFFRAIIAANQGEQLQMDDFNTGSVILGGLLFSFGWLAIMVVQIVMLSMRGQTIGKRLVGIKIVRYLDGSPAGFVNAWLLRSFVFGIITFILNFLLWLGSIFMIVNICFIFREDRRCIHDLVAGTKVVKVQKL